MAAKAILIDLAQRETMNDSATVAQALISRLQRGLGLPSRPHRFAGFAVLKAPDTPAVLIELGYLSNRTEERSLRRSSHRHKLGKLITSAVGEYFKYRHRIV